METYFQQLKDIIENNDAMIELYQRVFDVVDKAECITDISDWTHYVVSTIVPSISEYPANQIDAVIALILAEHVSRDMSYKGFVTQYAMYLKRNGGVY